MAPDEGEDAGGRRPFGSRLLSGPGPRFRGTKAYLLMLALWVTVGTVVTPIVMAVNDIRLYDFTERGYITCTASFMVVAALLMWAIAVSFMREA